MTSRRVERGSESALVERITEVTYEGPTTEWSTPDGCWDLVVLRKGKTTLIMQTGLISRPVKLENDAGDSYLAISFKPGVYVPALPGADMVDRSVVHPLAARRSFAMHDEMLEIPTFENADDLVRHLVRRGLLATDELVETAAAGHPRAISPRSMQRHFVAATGMTPKQLSQIKRACAAVALLRGGMAPAEVALEVGYSDQPHLTRSLRTLMGQTPAEIARTFAANARTSAANRSGTSHDE